MGGTHQRLHCVLHCRFSSHRKKSVRRSSPTWDTSDWSSECQALIQEACMGWHFLSSALNIDQGDYSAACSRDSIKLVGLLYRTGWLLTDFFQCPTSLSSQVLRHFVGRTQMDPFAHGGVYPQAPVLPVNTRDCQPYKVSGAAYVYVFTTMDKRTGLQDLALLFSLFLSTCCFTGSVYVCGRLLFLTLFRRDAWDTPEFGSAVTSGQLCANMGMIWLSWKYWDVLCFAPILLFTFLGSSALL